ncbi:hypothetical protein [Glycomyces sp. NRRL B-16210]|uniref:hypothetical protein n=1 Tax=Glycomyces sp. NRRL B-16210 TaxID=1463821 RepID=UPI00105B431F|nr:hypothetical protein [Glycomyces sp. NRRL B-16210]
MTGQDRSAFESGHPLPTEVIATLQVLLAGADPSFTALRAQIPFARVVGGCPCGCPSVGIEVDRLAIGPAPSRSSPIASGWYGDQTHDVVLFTEDGYLSSLELNSVSDDVPTTWPAPAILEPDTRRPT